MSRQAVYYLWKLPQELKFFFCYKIENILLMRGQYTLRDFKCFFTIAFISSTH